MLYVIAQNYALPLHISPAVTDDTTLYHMILFSIGVMEFMTSQLFQPPKETRLLHEPDASFMSYLKKRMVVDSSAPGVCPTAVLCKNVTTPSEFQLKYKDTCEHEVHGGLHSLLCKNQLSLEYLDNPYFKVAVADA